MVQAYIWLGSNIDDPPAQLKRALESIAKLPLTKLIQVSRFCETKPLGELEQPNYLNAAAEISTDLSPHELLSHLQAIESSQGRRREERWGSRTLDLDILLYGEEIIQTENLIIPHYDLKNREFVLQLLYEISPELCLPTGESIKMLKDSLPQGSQL